MGWDYRHTRDNSNPVTEDEIFDLETELLAGASPRDAAIVCAQDPMTIITVMRSDSPLGVRLRKSEAKAKIASVKELRDGDWKAHAHFLKNRYPEEWGDKKTVSLEAKQLSRLSRKELIAELERQLEILKAMPDEEFGLPQGAPLNASLVLAAGEDTTGDD